MSLNTLLENPHWAAMYRYSMLPPNNGFFATYPPQGSVGGNHPMFLWSNEYMYGSMKRGQSGSNTNNPYDGGITKFSSHVTPKLQQQVRTCGDVTVNSAGCQMAAVRKVYSTIATPAHENPQAIKRLSTFTPHPYGVSYKTGYSPEMAWIPPLSRQGGIN